MDLEGFKNLVCIKESDKLSVGAGKGIYLKMTDCDANLVENCATLSERSRFHDQYAFSIVSKHTLVDYDDLTPGADLMSSVLMQKHMIQLRMTYAVLWSMNFEERRVSIQDAIYKFWAPSKTFAFLNLRLDDMSSHQATKERGSLFEVTIGLDNLVQKDNVYFGSLVPLVGVVGGALFLSVLVIQATNYVFLSKLLNLAIVKSIFKFATYEEAHRLHSSNSLRKMAGEKPVSWLSYALEFELGCWQSFKQVCCCRCCRVGQRQRKMDRMFHKGGKKVEHILDVRSII